MWLRMMIYRLKPELKLVAWSMAFFLVTILISVAARADSSHCNFLDRGQGINKTELSEFDKCWLDEHKADELSGVHNGVFYVKLPEIGYVSTPVKMLTKFGEEESEQYVHYLITKAIEDNEVKKKADAREALIGELERVRSEITQAYGFMMLSGIAITKEQRDEIADLIALEAQLTAILYN